MPQAASLQHINRSNFFSTPPLPPSELPLRRRVAAYLREHYPEIPLAVIEKIDRCGEHGVYSRCGRPWCPDCAKRTARRTIARARRIDKALYQAGELGLASTMMTICPPPDVPASEVRSAHQRLAKAFTRLASSRPYQNLVKGAARGIEVSVNDCGLYHVHGHIVLVHEPSNGDAVRDMATHKIFSSLGVEPYFSEEWDGVAVEALARYCTKDATDDAQTWLELRAATVGAQRVSFSGVLRAANIRGSANGKKSRRREGA